VDYIPVHGYNPQEISTPYQACIKMIGIREVTIRHSCEATARNMRASVIIDRLKISLLMPLVEARRG
jgi:hypothetical protein